jgi:Mn2+/Fe2+ NRAMP family transporter
MPYHFRSYNYWSSIEMIDKLQRIAQAIQILRLPSIAVGLICFASIVMIIFTSRSHEDDRYLIPSIVGLIWAISTHSFIVTFRSVPEKADNSLKFIGKLKRSVSRGWYWIVGIVFLGTTLTVIFLSYRIFSIWFRDYGG